RLQVGGDPPDVDLRPLAQPEPDDAGAAYRLAAVDPLAQPVVHDGRVLAAAQQLVPPGECLAAVVQHDGVVAAADAGGPIRFAHPGVSSQVSHVQVTEGTRGRAPPLARPLANAG